MHDESDPVVALQRLLVVHRRTIEFLEVQRAYFGAFAPPYIWHQFDETRGEIARVKGDLRTLGVLVEDQPHDSTPASDQPVYGPANDGATLLPVYHRMLVDQVRYLPQLGPSPWGDLFLQLADLYVERALVPLVAIGSAPAPEQTSTLLDLMRVPGARILLEGESGSGKTTCLQMIALACAARATGEPASEASKIADWPSPIPLPILLNAHGIAAALVHADAAPDGMHQPGPSAFWSAIERWLRYSDLDALVPTIQLLLERGECLILIDDLDDFPGEPDQRAYLLALGRFISRYPNNRYLMTWRALETGAMAGLASFARYRIAPLDQQRMDAAMTRWYDAISDHINMLLPEDLSDRIAQLQGALYGDERLHEVARTPRGLALCVMAHAEGHALPLERAIVLRRLAHGLLAGWERASGGDARSVGYTRGVNTPSTTERWLGLLELLALAFQQRIEPGSDQPLALSYPEIKSYLSESRSMASIERRRAGIDMIAELVRWCCRSGLLALSGPATYTMPHRPLREYLAGRALAQLPDFPARAYALDGDSHWREPLLLAVHGTERGRALSSAPAFLDLLLGAYDPSDGTSRRNLLLAAECLLEMGERSLVEHTVGASVRERLASLMTASACPVEQRIQAGLLLGRLGDTRHDILAPPLALVPAGPYILGTSDGYADESPPQSVDVQTFAIGIYPVTNRDYGLFLNEHLAQPRPRYWYDPRFNNPACPVVGVTWHDAMNYCVWLQGRLARADLLPPGCVVRLPREVEWEKAASWDVARQHKRRYPWGDEWDGTRANTIDGRGAWYTAPIGCYPDGVSPYGLHDCIGNVWEWMIDQYTSYPGATQPFYEAGRYTLRGSSCASHHTHARCTYRSRLPPDVWRYHLGFRIVLGQPIR